MTEFIQVRMRKDTESPPEHEALIRFLLEKDEPPFALPSYVHWPRGERRMTERAIILMHAGIEHLKKAFPKKDTAREIEGAVTPPLSERSRESEPPPGW